MNYSEYKSFFDEIVKSEAPIAPYDNEFFFNYVKMNQARLKRWDKHLQLDSELVTLIENNKIQQHWIIISEPWCGDAAHIVPFIIRIAEVSPLISYEIQLRDKEPFLIDNYLTNGGKAIPKLIIRDENQNDLVVWGPRPQGAQAVYDNLKKNNATNDELSIGLQKWYNLNDGEEIQFELKNIFRKINQ
mgnify:CR=1 FL=1